MIKLVIFILLIISCENSAVTIKRKSFVMGSILEVNIIAEDSNSANYFINSVFLKFQLADQLWSNYKESSLISNINKQAGQDTVAIDSLTYKLFLAADSAYKETDRYFNICIQSYFESLKKDYKYVYNPKMINYENFFFDEKHAFLKYKGMAITVNGLAVGFMLEIVKKQFQSLSSIKKIYINHSGDIYYEDKRNSDPMIITIQLDTNFTKELVLNSGTSIAISGNYEILKVRDIGHIFNPEKNIPSKNRKGDYVIHKSPLWADILSTTKIAKQE